MKPCPLIACGAALLFSVTSVSHAAVLIFGDQNGLDTPNMPPGYKTFVLSAVSTEPAEPIIAIDFYDGGFGFRSEIGTIGQVWPGGMPTVFSDSNHLFPTIGAVPAQDSQFLVTSSSVILPIGAEGPTFLAGAFGAPNIFTGFGTQIPFARVVLPPQSLVAYGGQIAVRSTSGDVESWPVHGILTTLIGDLPIAANVDVGNRRRGSIINHTFDAVGAAPLVWSNLVTSGPASPAIPPELNSNGTFLWDTANSPLGRYTFETMVSNQFGADVGRISLNLVPTTFAILVGSNAPAWDNNGTVDDPLGIKGGLDVANVRDRLEHDPNWYTDIKTLVYNWTDPDTVANQINSAITDVASKITDEDTLFFYYSGHGSGGTLFGQNEELNVVEGGAYTDDMLTAALHDPRLADIRKIVIIDACHSGGFLTNDFEGLDSDIETLRNFAFLAAAKEDGITLADPNGTGTFTNAILSRLSADTTFDDLKAFAAEGYNGVWTGFFKDIGFGTINGEVFAYASPDFDTSLPLNGIRVPEPDLPGDFNGDHSVDAADYVFWRKNLSHDEAKYDEWRANFGNTSGSGSAFRAPVPEPSSLLSIAAMCWISVGRLRLRVERAQVLHGCRQARDREMSG